MLSIPTATNVGDLSSGGRIGHCRNVVTTFLLLQPPATPKSSLFLMLSLSCHTATTSIRCTVLGNRDPPTHSPLTMSATLKYLGKPLNFKDEVQNNHFIHPPTLNYVSPLEGPVIDPKVFGCCTKRPFFCQAVAIFFYFKVFLYFKNCWSA